VEFSGTAQSIAGIREFRAYETDASESYYYVVDRYRLRWMDVAYEPGELRAVAYKNGSVIGEASVRTTGAIDRIRLTPEWAVIDADGYDLAYILVEGLDSDSNVCPLADNYVTFEIDGPAEIVGVGNGNPLSFEPFLADGRTLFNGKAMLILRSLKGQPGTIELTAQSEGLESAHVTLRSK
jgi:beta-galactosidase